MYAERQRHGQSHDHPCVERPSPLVFARGKRKRTRDAGPARFLARPRAPGSSYSASHANVERSPPMPSKEQARDSSCSCSAALWRHRGGPNGQTPRGYCRRACRECVGCRREVKINVPPADTYNRDDSITTIEDDGGGVDADGSGRLYRCWTQSSPHGCCKAATAADWA
jgi:hypothetical protein